MMDRGVYLPCSQFEAAFTCAAMTDAEIDRTVAVAEESLKSL
jgi:glutamate-1-semialdehyde 2,1-aminomutase